MIYFYFYVAEYPNIIYSPCDATVVAVAVVELVAGIDVGVDAVYGHKKYHPISRVYVVDDCDRSAYQVTVPVLLCSFNDRDPDW